MENNSKKSFGIIVLRVIVTIIIALSFVILAFLSIKYMKDIVTKKDLIIIASIIIVDLLCCHILDYCEWIKNK